MNHTISVAMTTHNGSKFLRTQLDSIYNQTAHIHEIIVCDDASTDDTISILKEYNKKHGLVYHINETKLGYIKNFEKAISLCTGDYIALADQDDVWYNNKIETLYNEIGKSSLIFSDAVLINENGKCFHKSFKSYQKIRIPEPAEQKKTLFFWNFVTGCTCMFKRELVYDAVPLCGFIPHDWWLAIVAAHKKGIKYLPFPLLEYRQHSHNTIGAKKVSFLSILTKKNKTSRKEKVTTEFNRTRDILGYARHHKNSGKVFSESELLKMISFTEKFLTDISKRRFHPRACLIALRFRKYFFKSHQIIFALFKIWL